MGQQMLVYAPPLCPCLNGARFTGQMFTRSTHKSTTLHPIAKGSRIAYTSGFTDDPNIKSLESYMFQVKSMSGDGLHIIA